MSKDELVIGDDRLNAEGKHVYICAPRDNPVHTAAVGLIAEAFSAKGIPIHVAGALPAKGKWDAVAQENRIALIDALFVVAMVDWPQSDPHRKVVAAWPTPTRLHHNFRVDREVVKRTGQAALVDCEFVFTDAAVAHDIGFADACGIAVVGYVHSAPTSFTLPRSLAYALEGWLRGPRKLAEFVNSYKGLDAENAMAWDKLTKVKTK